MKCLKLGRLPKAKVKKVLNFRYNTPGSPHLVLNPTNPHPFQRNKIVDPTHPAAPLPIRAFYQRVPLYKTSAFSLRAFPKALLELPPAPVSYPALEREVLSREMGKRGDRVDVSLLWTGPKSIHKSAVVRTRLFRRFKTALGLALTRGVDAVEWGGGKGKGKGDGGKAPTRLRLVEGEDGDEMRRCVLSNWTYFLSPSLEVYRMPYPQLVASIRQALRSLHAAATEWERKWAHQRPRASRQTFHGDLERIGVSAFNTVDWSRGGIPGQSAFANPGSGGQKRDELGGLDPGMRLSDTPPRYSRNSATRSLEKRAAQSVGKTALRSLANSATRPSSAASRGVDDISTARPRVETMRIEERLASSLPWLELSAESEAELVEEIGLNPSNAGPLRRRQTSSAAQGSVGSRPGNSPLQTAASWLAEPEAELIEELGLNLPNAEPLRRHRTSSAARASASSRPGNPPPRTAASSWRGAYPSPTPKPAEGQPPSALPAKFSAADLLFKNTPIVTPPSGGKRWPKS